jgi:hypothetical protein
MVVLGNQGGNVSQHFTTSVCRQDLSFQHINWFRSGLAGGGDNAAGKENCRISRGITAR